MANTNIHSTMRNTMPTMAEDFDVFLASNKGHVAINRRRPDTDDDGPIFDVVRQVVEDVFDAEEAAQEREFTDANPVDYEKLADEQYQQEALEGLGYSVAMGLEPDKYVSEYFGSKAWKYTDTEAGATDRLDIHLEGDIYSAVVPIPDEIQKDFNIADLRDCGVEIEEGDKFILMVTADDNGIALVRQHEDPGFQKRFETAMHDHYASQMHGDIQQIRAEAAATEIAARPVQTAATVTAEYLAPAYDNQHGAIEVFKIAIDGENLAVNVRFDDAYRVAGIDLNETDSGYDFERDGIERGMQLETIVENHRESVIDAIHESNARNFENRLQQAGWSGDENLKAGYCVVSQSEIDRIKSAAEAESRRPFREQGSTTDGRPLNLTFDGRGNIETASPQGFAIQLKPVLENSRDHFIEAKAQLSDRDITVTKSTEGDYRVDYRAGTPGHVRGGEGSSSPHCEDVSEAVYTARGMIASRDSQQAAQMDAIWKAANDTSREDDLKRLVAHA